MASSEKTIDVGIVYPADPVGVIPGGIDTFIRGIIRSAPADIRIKLLGVTTEPEKRPVGKWTRCALGPKMFDFYPLLELSDPNARSRVPLSLRFTWELIKQRPTHNCDLLEFHRIEPSLVYYLSKLPRNAVIHQNMEVLRDKNADIKWRHVPGLYYRIEGWLLNKTNTVYCVRENAVEAYRERYPDRKEDFRFIPTWVDPDVFYPADEDERQRTRMELQQKYAIDPASKLLVTVGRLDQQKDPLLLLEAFSQVLQSEGGIQLLFIGDGVLRGDVESMISDKGLGDSVTLAGLQPQDEVSRIVRAADLFVLSSAYEGMPMCVLEALGCGVPVVSTAVGEVDRVVQPGVNGEICVDRESSGLATSIERVLTRLDRYRGKPCLSAIRNYVPVTVLAGFYENYRELVRGQ